MEQTAVEWLKEIYDSCNTYEKFIANIDWEQAKAMEKEQIVNAFEIGYDNGACVQEGNAIYHGSNYYNETFKSE
jgi:hypothetical protein